MPNWKFHNKIALHFGIPIEISNWVNKREDLPQFESSKDKGLQKFRESYPDSQPTYDEIATKGELYLKAWLLHLHIDRLETICEDVADGNFDTSEFDSLYEFAENAFVNSLSLRMIPNDINKFLVDNIKELIKEIPIPRFHLMNNP